MGYCYTRDGRLCCDRCDKVEGVRLRTCPHRVDGLPYCPAPALCSDCYRELKPGLHARCGELAAKRQAECDQDRAYIAAGRFKIATGWGDWHPAVPKGLIGYRFLGSEGREEFRLIPEPDDPNAPRKMWLDEYSTAMPWPNHP